MFLQLEEADPTNPSLVPDNDTPEVSQGEEDVGSPEMRTLDKTEKGKGKKDSPFFRGYVTSSGDKFQEIFASPKAKNVTKEARKIELDPTPADRIDLANTEGDFDFDTEDKTQFIEADLQDFSDIDDEDSADYTETRIKNRLYRYHLRETESKPEDLCNHEDNKEFIRECTEFILKKNLSRKIKKSNLDKSLGHLFTYPDCLLNFLAEKHDNFNLRRLVAFKDKNQFLQLKDPMLGWIKRTGGESGLENPSRQKEQLKAHENLRSFLIRKLKEEDFGNDLGLIVWSQKIRENIDQISEDIEHGEFFGQLNKLCEQDRQKILIAKSILKPDDNLKEVNALKVYFSSEKFRAREVKLNNVFQVAVEKDEIGHKDLYDVGNFARVLLGKNAIHCSDDEQ